MKNSYKIILFYDDDYYIRCHDASASFKLNELGNLYKSLLTNKSSNKISVRIYSKVMLTTKKKNEIRVLFENNGFVIDYFYVPVNHIHDVPNEYWSIGD